MNREMVRESMKYRQIRTRHHCTPGHNGHDPSAHRSELILGRICRDESESYLEILPNGLVDDVEPAKKNGNLACRRKHRRMRGKAQIRLKTQRSTVIIPMTWFEYGIMRDIVIATLENERAGTCLGLSSAKSVAELRVVMFYIF